MLGAMSLINNDFTLENILAEDVLFGFRFLQLNFKRVLDIKGQIKDIFWFTLKKGKNDEATTINYRFLQACKNNDNKTIQELYKIIDDYYKNDKTLCFVEVYTTEKIKPYYWEAEEPGFEFDIYEVPLMDALHVIPIEHYIELYYTGSYKFPYILTEPQREFIFKYIHGKTEEEWQEYNEMYNKVKEYFI